jgi:DNA-3-methyladenine glycosylase I
MINLEGAQAGLSWITILKKREGYLKAFDNFQAEKIVKYSDKHLEKLRENPEIIRNKLKIKAVRTNAEAYLKIKESGISFSDYIWKFVDHKPMVNKFKSHNEIPANTEVSDKMSKQMKKDGFKFIGSTIVYAFMQATGMVNDHITSCFRYEECNK